MFNGNSYPLTTAWIEDENTTTDDPSEIGISFFNKTNAEINSGNASGITYMYFDFSEVDLQETTYTNFLDYEVSINSTLVDGNFTSGTILLSDEDIDADEYALSATVTINSLTDTTVDLDFTFTRDDRQVISGSYVGNYTVPN